jgi:hypothetical protein
MKKILKKGLILIGKFLVLVIVLLGLYVLYNLSIFNTKHKLTKEETSLYLKQLDKVNSDPYHFVAEKFDTHSVVFIGELHKRRQDLEFFGKLIPYLYHEKDIKIIGWEFGAAEYQKDADSIVTAAEFDRKKAISILRRTEFFWCYEEYLNIFKIIWETNKGIENQNDKIRFLQLNKPYNSKWWNSRDNKIRLNEHKDNFDNILPKIVEKQVIQKNKKILIYCGLHHSFTRFQTPVFFFRKNPDLRAGQILYNKYPDKVFQITLISPFGPKWTIFKTIMGDQDFKFTYPFKGVFNQLYDTIKRPFAINSNNNVFAKLKDNNSFYAFDTWSGIKLKDFTDGCIMISSFEEIQPVHIIKDWVTTEEELNEVKSTLPDEDAASIKTIPDLIKYINAEGDMRVLLEFHKIKRFW